MIFTDLHKLEKVSRPIILGDQLKIQHISKLPHEIDLRYQNIPERITKPGNVIDIVTEKNSQETAYIVVNPKKRNMLGELTGIGIFAILIIFFANIAGTYGKGQRIFSKVTQSVTRGYQDLWKGGKRFQEGRMTSAGNLFEQAQNDFKKAQNEIWFFQQDRQLAKMTAVLDAGMYLSQAGTDVSEIIEILRGQKENENYLEIFKKMSTLSKKLAENLSKGSEALSRIEKKLIQKKFQQQFENGRLMLQKIATDIKKIETLIPGALKLLGAEGPQRIIVLFQNNDEIRPTGGFIGSYLIIEIENGLIKSMNLEDVYDIDDPFEEAIEPPAEIKKLTNRWFFRDSNYSADFRLSGEKALWLYEKETGLAGTQAAPKTIFAMNHSLLSRLLEITGPIEMSQLAVSITAENYRSVFTYIIESKFEGYEDPKKILKQFFPIFQQKLLQKMNSKAIQKVLLEEMTKKNILGFSRDPEIKKFFDQLGIDGKIVPPGEQEDYLAIIMSSFSGNKSDANVTQTVTHNTILESTGEILDELVIERTHRWSEEEFQKWKNILRPFGYKDFPPHIVNIIGQGDNKQSVRVYVPDGSVLVGTEGVAIDKVATLTDPALDMTYFSFDFLVESGTHKAIMLRYVLPLRLNTDPVAAYKFRIQKQPGIRPWIFHKNIIQNELMKLYNTYPDGLGQNTKGNIQTKMLLEKDAYISTLWGRNP